MASTPQRGPGMLLPLAPLSGLNNRRSIAAGTYHICPGGPYYISVDAYTQIESLDPITGLWNQISPVLGHTYCVESDGQNIRISNRTGTPIGALLTSNGTGYTAAPVVSANSGGSTWNPIIGGALTISVVSGGAGFNYQPQLIVAAPPAGGVPATAVANLSGGVISTVTMINQGAGYGAILPAVAVISDPREASSTTPGPTTAPVLSAVTAGSGTITALVLTNPGSAVTGVPTLTISGGTFTTSAVATAVMDTTVTGFTVTSAGAGYATAAAFGVVTAGGSVTAAPGAIVNPAIGPSAYTPRQAVLTGTTSGGTVVSAGQAVVDGGRVQAIPTAFLLAPGATALVTSGAVLAATVGGVTGYYVIQPL